MSAHGDSQGPAIADAVKDHPCNRCYHCADEIDGENGPEGGRAEEKRFIRQVKIHIGKRAHLAEQDIKADGIGSQKLRVF